MVEVYITNTVSDSLSLMFRQFPTPVTHSMEALPADSPLRKAYPEDTYPNGKRALRFCAHRFG